MYLIKHILKKLKETYGIKLSKQGFFSFKNKFLNEGEHYFYDSDISMIQITKTGYEKIMEYYGHRHAIKRMENS